MSKQYFCFMFRQIAALVFMMAFVIQTFSAPFIMLDYYANTNVYSKNCINKARPTMHCNGKCQMAKKMREEEKKEKQTQERKSEIKTETLSSKSFYHTITVFSINSDKPTVREINIAFTNYPKDFFHPPQASVSYISLLKLIQQA